VARKRSRGYVVCEGVGYEGELDERTFVNVHLLQPEGEYEQVILAWQMGVGGVG
jgi:hypothetical protein